MPAPKLESIFQIVWHQYKKNSMLMTLLRNPTNGGAQLQTELVLPGFG
jgi:hypothetical protein